MLALIAGAAQSAVPGEPAPPFSLPGSGGTVSLDAYRGKFVYVDFWASWCAPCKRSFPWMGELQRRYADQGLVVVAINVDASRADADRFLAATPPAFAVAFDPTGATPKHYAIKGMPSSVLVDPQGKVVFQHAGFTADTPRELEAKIGQAVRGGGAK
ncbi:MAG TPA: TlpA disulfide reductase family protein [Telluria sp.]|nr:TlpA disulfide reductase family protein [Telluria sp.]